MRFKLISFLILFFSMFVNAQIENLGKYKTDKYDNEFVIFKIKGKKYKTDFHKLFIVDSTKIFENATDNILHFMIYDKKYLFVGYFPNTKEQQISSIGYELRSLNRLDVIDLKNTLKKWSYQFENKTAMENIKFFNPKNGDITYYNYIKPIREN